MCRVCMCLARYCQPRLAQLAACARAPSCARARARPRVRARVCGCVRARIRVPSPRIGCGWNIIVMAPYLNDPDEPFRDVSTLPSLQPVRALQATEPRLRTCTAVWCAAAPCTHLARHAPVVHRFLPRGKVHALAVLRLPGAAARRCLPPLNWIGRAASRTGRFRRPTVLCMRVDRCLWIAAAARTQPVRADHTLLKPYGATALPIEPTHRCAGAVGVGYRPQVAFRDGLCFRRHACRRDHVPLLSQA